MLLRRHLGRARAQELRQALTDRGPRTEDRERTRILPKWPSTPPKTSPFSKGSSPVRKRPGMYIGGVGSAGLHHLVWEIARQRRRRGDERLRVEHLRHAPRRRHRRSRSKTTAAAFRSTSIRRTKKSALEVIFTVLHAGGKFEHGNYKTAGGLHGVGASVVNALSKELVATVKRDGAQWEMRFKQGKPVGALKKIGAGARHRHDGLLPARRRRSSRRSSSTPRSIRERLEVASYLHKGAEGHLRGRRRRRTKIVFEHERGARRLPEEDRRRARRQAGARRAVHADARTTGCGSISCCSGPRRPTSTSASYVNGIPTGSGGTHENGLRAGIGKAVRNFIETHNLVAEGRDAHRRGHPRRARSACSASSSQEPQFQGQTKDRLNNPEVHVGGRRRRAPGARALAEPQQQRRRGDRRAHHPGGARARGQPRARRPRCRARARRRTRLNLPGKLSDCTNSTRDGQRALHRRGRLGRRLGEAGARSRAPGDPAAARQGAEHRERVAREGAREQGAGRSGHRARLRPRQELRAVDSCATARSSSSPTPTPTATTSRRCCSRSSTATCRSSSTNGKVFLAQPPLYRIDIGKETFWALDDAQRDAILKQHGKNGRGTPEITRFKGLGEMMPKVLWETTLNPRTRRLLRVEVTDQIVDRPRHQRADGQGRVGALPLHHGARGRSGGAGRLDGGRFPAAWLVREAADGQAAPVTRLRSSRAAA